MLFKHHSRYCSVMQVGMDVAISLPEVCGVLLGTPRLSLDQLFPSRRTENPNSNISRSYLTTTALYVSKKSMEETSISRLSRCWLRGFVFFATFFLGNENAGGSSICIHRDLLPEEAIVTHLITCQGRDHTVNIQSGRQSLVIVNVQFEPELFLRQFRERLHLIKPHWPLYPNAVDIIFV